MSFFAASPSPELPLLPLLLVNCTFKWKIFGSQQKHCIQKRQSRSYYSTEEIVPGKLLSVGTVGFFFLSPYRFEEVFSADVLGAAARPVAAFVRRGSVFKGSTLLRGREKFYSTAFVTKLQQSGPLQAARRKQGGEIKREGAKKTSFFAM